MSHPGKSKSPDADIKVSVGKVRVDPSAVAAILLLVLTALSIYVVYRGASDEPYVRFHFLDALEQVGLGGLLMIGWIYYVVATLREVSENRISAGWMATWVWVVIMCFYLGCSVFGYVSDLINFRDMPL